VEPKETPPSTAATRVGARREPGAPGGEPARELRVEPLERRTARIDGPDEMISRWRERPWDDMLPAHQRSQRIAGEAGDARLLAPVGTRADHARARGVARDHSHDEGVVHAALGAEDDGRE